jgi:hypothetical protein
VQVKQCRCPERANPMAGARSFYHLEVLEVHILWGSDLRVSAPSEAKRE